MAYTNSPSVRVPATALEAQEFEWTRVSRILHDQVGQILSAIGLQLDLLRMDLKEETPEIVPRTQEIQRLLDTRSLKCAISAMKWIRRWWNKAGFPPRWIA